MRFRSSFYEHGVTEQEAYEVMAYRLWVQICDSERGNEQVMYVGWNQTGRLLETGVELYPEGEEDWASHARRASEFYRKQVGL